MTYRKVPLNGFIFLGALVFSFFLGYLIGATIEINESQSNRSNQLSIDVICLDGVEYYVTHESTPMNGYLAVRYQNSEIVSCDK